MYKILIFLKYTFTLCFFCLIKLTPISAQDFRNFKDKTLHRLAETGGCMALLAEGPLLKVFANLENKNIATQLKDGSWVNLQLGKKLGSGFYGSFYFFDSKSLPKLYSPELILGAKIPHSLPGTSLSIGYAKREAEKEWRLYNRMIEVLYYIEDHPLYPKSHAWKIGSTPIVPIIESLETQKGRWLFKPIIKKAKFLKDLAQEYKQTGELSEAYKTCLWEVYKFAQAFYFVTGVSPDIRPTNWAYVDDPQMMRMLNYERPGFVLFEISQVPFNLKKYINPYFTFEQFLEEFETYLKRELDKN
jgi:hypothetical protein